MKENYCEEINSGIDEPLKDNNELKNNNKVKIIPTEEVDDIERKARYYEKMDKHIYKHHGFQLLIGCGVVYLSIVILDTIVSNAFNWKSSELTKEFLELVKFVISTLIGYVFSETQKNKNE
ncbi:MAG: lung seven transmembrane receptor family protein [Ruminococcus sp.]|nr:lung seven transmembrane receptor family protein [Ruminococcus sp.]